MASLSSALGWRPRGPRRWRTSRDVDFSAADAAGQLLRAYLSPQHLDDIDASCPLIALPSEVARADPKVKLAFERVFTTMVDLFEAALQDRRRALAIAGISVGGMVVARGVADDNLADELRKATLAVALELGGWSTAKGERKRARGRGTASKLPRVTRSRHA